MLNRRGLLIMGSAAASLTLIGNKEVLALVAQTDRYHFSITTAEHLLAALPPSFHAYRAFEKDVPARKWGTLEYPAYKAARAEFYEEFIRLRQTDEHPPAGREFEGGFIRVRESAEGKPHFSMREIGPGYRAWLTESDQFLREVMRLFPEQPDFASTQKLLNNEIAVDAFDETQLRTLVPSLVPIALIRALVQKERVPFHMLMPQFQVFAERYRDVIMV